MTETCSNAMDMQSLATMTEEDMENLGNDTNYTVSNSYKQFEKIKESNLHIKLSNIDSALMVNDRKENEELDDLLALNELGLEDAAASDNGITKTL